MARISKKAWDKYISMLSRLSDRAAKEMLSTLTSLEAKYKSGNISLKEYENAAIDYAYALATRYGEGAGEAACEMYDAIAEMQNADIPPAVPAATATKSETAETIVGTLKTGNIEIVAAATGRLVKQAGADTTLQNASRDGAYFAWIAHGDTCPYCMTLAALGWRKAGKLTLEGGHAEHIHSNCDCEYAIDFRGDLKIAGYDPGKLNRRIMDMTGEEYDAEDIIRVSGHNAKGHDHEGLNLLRRKIYAQNRETINAQKRAAYAKRIERDATE